MTLVLLAPGRLDTTWLDMGPISKWPLGHHHHLGSFPPPTFPMAGQNICWFSYPWNSIKAKWLSNKNSAVKFLIQINTVQKVQLHKIVWNQNGSHSDTMCGHSRVLLNEFLWLLNGPFQYVKAVNQTSEFKMMNVKKRKIEHQSSDSDSDDPRSPVFKTGYNSVIAVQL